MEKKQIKTAEEIFNDYVNIRTVGNDIAQNIIDAMVTYASQFKDHSATIEMLEQEIKLLDSEKSNKDKSIEILTEALEEIFDSLQRGDYITASNIAKDNISPRQ